MVTELKVSGWRCLKDVTLQLTPLHALIGPNDSGKSLLLEALFRACNLGTPDEPRAWFEVRTKQISMRSVWRQSFSGEHIVRARTELGTPRRLKLDPEKLRQPSHLLPKDNVWLGEHGEHLPGVYDAILGRDREAWDRIERRAQEAFPMVKRLALSAIDDARKVLEVELLDETRVPASLTSEGLLYWLAFAALPHMSPVKLLVIEKPENGLHPLRIAEMIAALRQLVAQGTQVVLETHSPLVVAELEPEEISVVSRGLELGTRVRGLPALSERERGAVLASMGGY